MFFWSDVVLYVFLIWFFVVEDIGFEVVVFNEGLVVDVELLVEDDGSFCWVG